MLLLIKILWKDCTVRLKKKVTLFILVKIRSYEILNICRWIYIYKVFLRRLINWLFKINSWTNEGSLNALWFQFQTVVAQVNPDQRVKVSSSIIIQLQTGHLRALSCPGQNTVNRRNCRATTGWWRTGLITALAPTWQVRGVTLPGLPWPGHARSLSVLGHPVLA